MTNRLSTSAVALAATIFAASAAYAADLGNQGDPTSAAYSAPISFTGFYIGVQGGYGNANHNLTIEQSNGSYCFDTFGDEADFPENFDPADPTSWPKNIFGDPRALLAATEQECSEIETDGIAGQYFPVSAGTRETASLDGLNSSGLIGGVSAGLDKQAGKFVFGVFGSYNLAEMSSSNDGFLKAVRGGGSASEDGHVIDLQKAEKENEWSLGARAGLLVNPETLLYILAAYTQSDYKFSGEDRGEAVSKTVTFDGISVGGGIEFALMSNVFLGAEYTHTFYDSEVIADTGVGEGCVVCRRETLTDDLDEDKIMGTLKIKLNKDIFGN